VTSGDGPIDARSLARLRAIAVRVQAALERLYQLERIASIEDFVESGGAGEREALLLREAPGGDLEVRVTLPALSAPGSGLPFDTLCQIIEGVSHFVYVVERARRGRKTTQLELEVQAEVDKWVVLAASMRSFDARGSAELRARLYEGFALVHDGETLEHRELAERYRVANDAAHGFVRRLEREYVGPARFAELHAALWRFFHVGQEGKLRLGRAA
jgi:hypothetical protein